jgi:transcriptional regulator with XRE-family HTH domain
MVKDGDVQKRRVIVSIAETDVSKVRWTKEKAELLSQWKREKGCSLQAISDTGGYSKTAIAKIIAGEWEEVDYESIKVIADYLGHSYSELGQVITTSIPE